MGTLAYTVGSDIAFSQGHLNPGNEEGKRLVAHELTHVIQQDHGRLRLQRLSVGSSGDPLEAEADQAAEQVVSSEEGEPMQAQNTKAPKDPCAQTVLAEGDCQHLATKST